MWMCPSIRLSVHRMTGIDETWFFVPLFSQGLEISILCTRTVCSEVKIIGIGNRRYLLIDMLKKS